MLYNGDLDLIISELLRVINVAQNKADLYVGTIVGKDHGSSVVCDVRLSDTRDWCEMLQTHKTTHLGLDLHFNLGL